MTRPVLRGWLLSGCLLTAAFATGDVSASDAANAAVPTAPVIDRQPIGRVVTERGHVTLSVLASAAGPISYQWLSNGATIADSGRLTGAATPVLNIDPAQLADSANYSVVATSGGASVTSVVAAVVVNRPAFAVIPRGSTGVVVSVLGQVGDVYRIEESPDFLFLTYRTNGFATNVGGVAPFEMPVTGPAGYLRARFDHMLPVLYPTQGQGRGVHAYGKRDQVWRLQSSADLRSWNDRITVTNKTGWFFFTDTAGPEPCFYRIAPQ